MFYQDLDDLIRACTNIGEEGRVFDVSCFTGDYCTGDVSDEYLAMLESQRNDAAKNNSESNEPEEIDSIDIHNED